MPAPWLVRLSPTFAWLVRFMFLLLHSHQSLCCDRGKVETAHVIVQRIPRLSTFHFFPVGLTQNFRKIVVCSNNPNNKGTTISVGHLRG